MVKIVVGGFNASCFFVCLVATFRVVTAFRRSGELKGGLRDGREHGEATAGAYWHSVRARKVVFITISSRHLHTCPFRSLTMDMLAPT